MDTIIDVRIDKDSKTLLLRQKNKVLKKIGYVENTQFSYKTVLVFDDATYLVKNTPKVMEDGEEYPCFSVEPIHVEDDLAFDNERFRYMDFDSALEKIETINTIIIDKQISYHIQNGIVLHMGGGSVVLYAMDTIAGTTAIFEGTEGLEKRYPLEEEWVLVNEDDNPKTGVRYQREYLEI